MKRRGGDQNKVHPSMQSLRVQFTIRIKPKTSGRIHDILVTITLAAEIETPENLSGLTPNLGNLRTAVYFLLM